MKVLIQELILFLLSFLLVFIIYQLFIVRRAKPRKNKKKDKRIKEPKEPMEVTYLVNKGLDLKKIDYNKLLFIVSLVSSIDIALTVSIIMFLNNFILEIIVGFISIFIIILLSYELVYLVYKKKGMVKNESKRNRS